jgi:hypothetical protein
MEVPVEHFHFDDEIQLEAVHRNCMHQLKSPGPLQVSVEIQNHVPFMGHTK